MQHASRRRETCPGVDVWKAYTGSASDRLDVKAAAVKVSRTVFAVAALLGKQIQPFATGASPSGPPSIGAVLDSKGIEGLRRLQQRATAAKVDCWDLLWGSNAEGWEDAITQSFAAGMSQQLEDSTAQYQLLGHPIPEQFKPRRRAYKPPCFATAKYAAKLVYEFRVALLVGRTLVAAADSVGLDISFKQEVQYRCEGGNTIHVVTVDLIFPATEHSIKRLMTAWWDAKGGRPSTKEARLAREATKASSRGMPVRFRVALLMLHYWQEKLLTALVDINKQMLSNKAAGMVNWFHPASLTSGGRYANHSAPLRAIQAARGMLANAWHIYTGGRQAEGFRWRWTDTGVEGVAENHKPPIWTLGLAGVLQEFQAAFGTGYYMTNYHCKVISKSAAWLTV